MSTPIFGRKQGPRRIGSSARIREASANSPASSKPQHNFAQAHPPVVHATASPVPAPLPSGHTVFQKLNSDLQRALVDTGYSVPTPIQAQAIEPVLQGRDVLGCAQTGTGKTAAFSLPILHNLAIHHSRPLRGHPRVLILAPTRELAAQIGGCIGEYGRHLGITRTVIFGGVKASKQIAALNQGKDILVATPGRLLDLMNQGVVKLDKVTTFVLDEADRMLDMGFIRDIKKVIAALPVKRQTLFFSATMLPVVADLASSLLSRPVKISITPEQPTVERIVQKMYFVDKNNKLDLLINLLNGSHLDRVLVFVQMKHVANRVERKLSMAGIDSCALHGNKSQNARTEALDRFKNGRARVLVATDIAARGIDVENISHVINYELPVEPQTYIHRIGRTARAGAEGDAISFCAAEERNYLRAIEGLLRKEIPQILDHPYHDERARTARGEDAKPAPRRSHQSRRQSPQNSDSQRVRMERPARGQFLNDRPPPRKSGPRRPAGGSGKRG